MKSVGEVMAIGRKFEEALQKALRMLDIGVGGLVGNENFRVHRSGEGAARAHARADLCHPGGHASRATRLSASTSFRASTSGFFTRFGTSLNSTRTGCARRRAALPRELLLAAKQLRFCRPQDRRSLQLEERSGPRAAAELGHRSVREADRYSGGRVSGARPTTCTSPTTARKTMSPASEQNSVIVLGSGAYRIGSSVEFDWCCVNTVHDAAKAGLPARSSSTTTPKPSAPTTTSATSFTSTN